jgi:hypothetical protein
VVKNLATKRHRKHKEKTLSPRSLKEREEKTLSPQGRKSTRKISADQWLKT